MRVCVLAHNLIAAGGRSVGINLGRALAAELGADATLVVPSSYPDEMMESVRASGATVTPVRFPSVVQRTYFEFKQVRSLLRAARPDWVLGLGNIPYPSRHWKSAVLLHDPHLFYPRHWYSPDSATTRLNKAALRTLLRARLGRTDLVFAQTTAAKARVEESFRIRHIEVLPNAVSGDIPPPTAQRRSQRRWTEPGSFNVLYLTRYYPHKNLESLVAAFRQHPDLLHGVRCYLTIEPDDDPRAARLLHLISLPPLSERVVNLGRVAQADLASLYEESDALVMPTRLESFSAAYIEAMRFGVPIATSDADFAHSVCKDAAVYFDPLRVDSIASAIAGLRDDPAERQRLVAAGRHRLTQLAGDWPTLARTAIEAMRGLLTRRTP
jgi:glycosyltransferase involved in cell wall biosynthesis